MMMRGVEAAEDPHDQAIAAYSTRLAHHHCGDLGSRHRPASIGRGHKEENDWHGSFHHRFGGRAAAIHRVPKRPEVCVVVPVTILLHSDRATCGGDGRAICCGDGHEPVTATHALVTPADIVMWGLGALSWVIAWVFAGISLASKSRQRHG